VRFLIDESLSARVAQLLRAEGHDAVHVEDRNLLGAADTAVMDTAAAEQRTVVSADTDFGELLALGRHPGPSVILLRRCPHSPQEQVRLLLSILIDVEDSVIRGAVVTVRPDRARIRLLPILPEQ
jgi:predicted nuclease of predicted toxin-antitoxin system